MNYKSLIYFTIFSVILFGASHNTFGQSELPTLDREEVYIDNDGHASDPTTRKPFTGIVTHRNGFGKLQLSFEYKNGVLDGFQRAYDDQGKEVFRQEWVAGKEHGLGIEYFSNGKKKSECRSIDGIVEGKITQWYDSGEVCITGQYAKSRKDGIWRHFSKNGETIEIVTFENGILKSALIGKRDVQEACEYWLKLDADAKK